MKLIAMRRRDRHHTGEMFFAAALFFASVGFVLWQNARLTVLWDISYILENAARIAKGQIPYRDFPFPYAPLTFFTQAAIIRLFGRAVWHHQLYSAFVGGLGTVVTWRLLRHVFSASALDRNVFEGGTSPANAGVCSSRESSVRWLSLLLAAPLIFLGTNSIFPHPFYDSDCTVFILCWLWLWLRCDRENYPRALTFLCGALMVVPIFIKQNTGLAFFASVAICVAWMLLRGVRRAWPLLAGAVVGLAISIALVQSFFGVGNTGLGNYLHWTIGFAASRRLPGMATMLGVYQDASLLWPAAAFSLGLALWMSSRWIASRFANSVIRWLAVALLLSPFVAAVAALFLQDNDSDRIEALLRLWPIVLITALLFALVHIIQNIRHRRAPSAFSLVPIILLGTVHGAFLSQQLWGSTYALWPMFLLLLAGVVATLTHQEDAIPRTSAPALVLTAILALLLTANGAYYAFCHERLDYVALDSNIGDSTTGNATSGDAEDSAAKNSAFGPDDSLHHSHLPSLRGLAMRGPWLGDFDELADYAARNIPANDAILEVPGEDLFYFATGRTPQFPVILMDNTVNPYSAAELARLAHEKNVRWIIVKRRLQLQEQPIPFRANLLELLSADFQVEKQLRNYDVYRHR